MSALPDQNSISANPAAFLETLWQLLDLGTRSAESPFHLGVLASAAECGVEARTVVLRRIHPDSRLLRFHTDKRSPKCDQLSRNPNVAWVFYDPVHQLQLRINGSAFPAECELAPPPEKAWRNYSTTMPPGTPLAPDEPAWPVQGDPEAAMLANFGSYDVKIERMEFLHLTKPTPLRGVFSFRIDGEYDFTFVTP